MTAQLTPLYSMTMKTGESLIQDMSRNLAAMEDANLKTKTRYQDWKAVVKQPQDAQATSLVEAGMLGFFLDFLFGMPMFSGMSDTAKGLFDIGVMTHSDRAKQDQSMPNMAALNRLMSQQGARRDATLSMNKQNAAQMKKMRMLVMMMVMMMAEHQAEEGSQGGEGGTAPEYAQDVLRHPKLARFKQNRHSLACIRQMFNAQADAVAPRFDAPRCEAA